MVRDDSTTQQSALSIADSNDFYFDADFTMECYAFRGIAPTTVSGVFGQWDYMVAQIVMCNFIGCQMVLFAA